MENGENQLSSRQGRGKMIFKSIRIYGFVCFLIKVVLLFIINNNVSAQTIMNLTEYMKVPDVINVTTIRQKLESPNEQSRLLGLKLFIDYLDRNEAFDNIHLLLPFLEGDSPYYRERGYTYLGKLFLTCKYPYSIPQFNPARQPFDDRYKKAAKFAVPYLIKGLHDENLIAIQSSASSLGYIGPMARSSIPYLIQLLKHNDRWVRHNSVVALGNFGSYSRNAIPHIAKLLNDPREHVRWIAARAIKVIQGE